MNTNTHTHAPNLSLFHTLARINNKHPPNKTLVYLFRLFSRKYQPQPKMDKNILPDRVMATVCTLVFVSLSAFYYVNFTPTNMTLTISQSVAKVGNTTDVNKESMQSFLLPNPNVSQECTRSFERSHMTKVLLITYYRGGSSFLGQMFAQKRDAFYWFEPLDDVKLTMSNSMVNMANEIKMVGTNYQLLDNGTLG